MSNDEVTVLRYRLDRKQWFNRISFAITDVPLNWALYVLDSNDHLYPVNDKNGNSIKGRYTSSDSNVLKSIKDRSWSYTTHSFEINPVYSNTIEIHINQRVSSDTYKDLVDANVEWYSVGVKDFEIKNVVTNRSEISSQPIGIKDPVGNNERLVLRDWDARKAIDDDSNTHWKSEPVPYSDAVVEYFIDLGEPTQFDRISLDPLSPGVHMNIYTSNDVSSGPFILSNSKIPLPSTSAADRVDWVEGLGFQTNNGRAYVPTDYFLPGSNWFVGMTWTPEGDPEDTQVAGFVDIKPDDIRVYYYDNNIVVKKSGSNVISVPVTWDLGDSINISVGGHSTRLFLNVGTSFFNVAATNGTITPDDFFIGSTAPSSSANQSYNSKGHISNLWVRADRSNDFASKTAQAYRSVHRSFDNDPEGFMAMVGERAITRADHMCIMAGALTDSLEVRYGPGDGYFEFKTWTPIAGDFTLAKATYDLAPVTARFVKLEFTNLVPQPYPVWNEDIVRRVKFFPNSVYEYTNRIDKQSTTIASKQLYDRRLEGVLGNTETDNWIAQNKSATIRVLQ